MRQDKLFKLFQLRSSRQCCEALHCRQEGRLLSLIFLDDLVNFNQEMTTVPGINYLVRLRDIDKENVLGVTRSRGHDDFRIRLVYWYIRSPGTAFPSF